MVETDQDQHLVLNLSHKEVCHQIKKNKFCTNKWEQDPDQTHLNKRKRIQNLKEDDFICIIYHFFKLFCLTFENKYCKKIS